MNTSTPNEEGRHQSRTYIEDDIAAFLGIGRGLAHKLTNSGSSKTVRIFRRPFENWLKMGSRITKYRSATTEQVVAERYYLYAHFVRWFFGVISLDDKEDGI